MYTLVCFCFSSKDFGTSCRLTVPPVAEGRRVQLTRFLLTIKCMSKVSKELLT